MKASMFSDSIFLRRLLFFIVIPLTVLLSINIYILMLVLSLMLILVLILKNKFIHTVFIAPFLAISLMPSQYTVFFRYESPIGELRTEFIFLLLGIIIFFIISIKKTDLTTLKNFSWILFIIAIYYIINILSVLVNDLGLNGIRYTFLNFIFSFGIVFMSIVARRWIKPLKVLKSFVIISTLVCLLGILEFLEVFRPYTALYLLDNPWFNYAPGTGNIRIASSIGNPLVLSGYLLLMLPITIYVREKVEGKSFLNITIIIHVIALLLTQSRSAYLILFLIVLYYSTKSVKSFFTNISKISCIIVFFWLVLNLFGLDKIFFDRLFFKSEFESISIRKDAFSIAFDLAAEKYYMLIGSGPNSINEILFKNNINQVTTLDNVYLMILTSTGILGLIAFLSIIIVLWVKFNKMEREIKKTGFCLLFVFFGIGFSFNTIYFNVIWGVFWFLTSVLILFDMNLKQENKVKLLEQV